MSIVQPTKERHTLQDDGSLFKFTIPSRKNCIAIFYLGFWIIFWAFGEIMVGSIFSKALIGSYSKQISDNSAGVSAILFMGVFLFIWLTIWTAGGIYAIYTFLWQLAGKEVVEITNESIRYQRAILGLGRVKEYLTTHIKELRVSPLMVTHRLFGRSKVVGLIAFDYGARTYRFGEGIDEAEAKLILEKIFLRFPLLKAL
jgi:hypothetical protein